MRDYWCFISYRHSDNREEGRKWATWLHHQIETYEVPSELVGTTTPRGDTIPDRIFPVFRDEEELPADADLSDPIERALERSKFLVVLCSPGAVASRYVSEEILAFKRLGRSDRVLAVIIDGEPNASRDPSKTGAECFPSALVHPVAPDGSLRVAELSEPIAADLRLADGGQGWTSPEAYRQMLRADPSLDRGTVERRVREYRQRCHLAILKVISGILGVPLGTLSKRDQAYQLAKSRRRQRILVGVVAVLIALVVAAFAASVIAWKNEQRARRNAADSANQLAIASLRTRSLGEASSALASIPPDLRKPSWNYLSGLTHGVVWKSFTAPFPVRTIPIEARGQVLVGERLLDLSDGSLLNKVPEGIRSVSPDGRMGLGICSGIPDPEVPLSEIERGSGDTSDMVWICLVDLSTGLSTTQVAAPDGQIDLLATNWTSGETIIQTDEPSVMLMRHADGALLPLQLPDDTRIIEALHWGSDEGWLLAGSDGRLFNVVPELSGRDGSVRPHRDKDNLPWSEDQTFDLVAWHPKRPGVLAWISRESGIAAWEGRNGEGEWTIIPIEGPDPTTTSLSCGTISTSGDLLLLAKDGAWRIHSELDPAPRTSGGTPSFGEASVVERGSYDLDPARFSPSGELFYTHQYGEGPPILQVFRTSDGGLIAQLNHHVDFVSQLYFLRGERDVLTQSVDGSVARITLERAARTSRFPDSARASDVSFSRSGAVVATSHRDNVTKVWELPGASLRSEFLTANPGPLCLSSDGNRLVCGTNLYDTETGKPVDIPNIGVVISISATLPARGIIRDADGRLLLWREENPSETAVLTDSGEAATITRDGRVAFWSQGKVLHGIGIDDNAPAAVTMTLKDEPDFDDLERIVPTTPKFYLVCHEGDRSTKSNRPVFWDVKASSFIKPDFESGIAWSGELHEDRGLFAFSTVINQIVLMDLGGRSPISIHPPAAAQSESGRISPLANHFMTGGWDLSGEHQILWSVNDHSRVIDLCSTEGEDGGSAFHFLPDESALLAFCSDAIELRQWGSLISPPVNPSSRISNGNSQRDVLLKLGYDSLLDATLDAADRQDADLLGLLFKRGAQPGFVHDRWDGKSINMEKLFWRAVKKLENREAILRVFEEAGFCYADEFAKCLTSYLSSTESEIRSLLILDVVNVDAPLELSPSMIDLPSPILPLHVLLSRADGIDSDKQAKAKILIDGGATPTAWYHAAEGDAEGLSRDLEDGHLVDAQDEYGETCLIHGVRNGHLTVVELLIAKGAKLNVSDRNGTTAARMAIDRYLEHRRNQSDSKGPGGTLEERKSIERLLSEALSDE